MFESSLISAARKGVWTGPRPAFVAVSACALLLSLMLAIAPGVANAASELDQKQESTVGGASDVFSGQVQAQTFTAGKSGTLEKIELNLSQFGVGGTPTQPLTVEITEVKASGEPDTTKVLGSASFGPATLPNFQNGEGAWVPFNITAPSKAGTSYAIVASSSTPSGAEYLWNDSNLNPYAGGEAWEGGTVLTSFLDETFRTYVVAAPTLPTSRKQCREGGWKNFGTTFKNHGQCVSFVVTGRLQAGTPHTHH